MRVENPLHGVQNFPHPTFKEREGSYKLTFFKKERVVNKREEIKWVISLSLSLSLKMVPKRVSFGKGWFYRNGFM